MPPYDTIVVWWQVGIGKHRILAVRAPVVVYTFLRKIDARDVSNF